MEIIQNIFYDIEYSKIRIYLTRELVSLLQMTRCMEVARRYRRTTLFFANFYGMKKSNWLQRFPRGFRREIESSGSENVQL